LAKRPNGLGLPVLAVSIKIVECFRASADAFAVLSACERFTWDIAGTAVILDSFAALLRMSSL